MIRSLQRVLPTLSGDVKIRFLTELDGQPQSVKTGRCRSARLLPLTSRTLAGTACNLLTSDYSRDLRTFYASCRDTFYDASVLSGLPDVKDYPESNFNMAFWRGCERVKNGDNSGCQYEFFAPLWTDSALPDTFRITVKAGNYSERHIDIPFDTDDADNYLGVYLSRYVKELDDKVMRLDPGIDTAWIYGLSLERGGFAASKARVSSLWSTYKTANRFDYILA